MQCRSRKLPIISRFQQGAFARCYLMENYLALKKALLGTFFILTSTRLESAALSSASLQMTASTKRQPSGVNAGILLTLTIKNSRKGNEILSMAETHTGEFSGKTPKVEKLHLHRYTLYEIHRIIYMKKFPAFSDAVILHQINQQQAKIIFAALRVLDAHLSLENLASQSTSTHRTS